MTGRKRNVGPETELDLGEQDESFLARWSRRKSESRRADDGPAPAAETPLEDAPVEGQAAEEPAPPTDADLPSLGELDQDSDYSPFLAAGVSPDLRRKALRQLFRSAKFNVIDGLDDYCEDLTSFQPLGDIVTADMKARAEDLIRDKLAGDPSADASPDAEDGRVAPDAATAQPERVASARRDGEPGPANGPGDETTAGDDHERDDA